MSFEPSRNTHTREEPLSILSPFFLAVYTHSSPAYPLPQPFKL